jgi:hypothetical protein
VTGDGPIDAPAAADAGRTAGDGADTAAAATIWDSTRTFWDNAVWN